MTYHRHRYFAQVPDRRGKIGHVALGYDHSERLSEISSLFWTSG